MGKVSTIQTNFTAGELSPRIGSRVDVAKYNNGLKVGENLQFLVQGGARRRPGTRISAETKHSDKRSRLIPFVYNRDQAYMLEVGNLYIRIFANGVSLSGTYEIVTPYTEAMLDDISYVQGADTMFLAHPDVPLYRLQRFADLDWRLLAAPFVVEPFAEMGYNPNLALTLSAATVGTGRNFTTAVGCFIEADVGRDIVFGSSLATITNFLSVTAVTCEIKSAFPSTSVAAGAWKMESTVQTACTPSAATPIGASITLTLAIAGWRGVDVGKYVKINGGLVKITGYTSGVQVTGTIQQVLSSATAAISNSWTLNSSIWGGTNGYPRAVTLHEQRLELAGSPGFPQTLLGSRIGDYLNFELGSKDDDAYSYELSTSQIAPIQHLTQSRRLMVFTSSNEMSVRGGTEKPITPTNIQKNDESTAGANVVRPVKVGNEILFVQRAGRKVRACGYRADIDAFDSPDRTVFSEHITTSGITDMAFQRDPDALLSCVRTDGELATSTYDTEQEVNAWGRWTTDGLFESVATIPTADSEQTWVIVNRTINSVTKRFVEYFDPAVYTDCCKVQTAGSPTASWGNMIHLEGKTVKAIADGVYQGEFVVSSGSITLPRTASTVEIGLGYVPTMTLLTPEAGGQTGTAQGAAISVGEVIVRVLDTVSVNVNGQHVSFRTMGGDLLDQEPTVGSGDLRETTLSDNLYRNELTISQPNPVAFHVLAVIRKCSIND